MAVNGTPAWERRYAMKVIASDIVVVVISVAAAQLLRYGLSVAELQISVTDQTRFAIDYTLISMALVSGWLLALSIFDTRDPKVIGLGSDEYKRVINATFATFGSLAIIAFLMKSHVGRGYLLIALPVGLILLLVSRWVWRKRLHQQRRRKKNVYQTLLVGERSKCEHVARELARSQYAGFNILGALTDKGSPVDLIPGLPVIGSLMDIVPTIDSHDIDKLILISTDAISAEEMRHIGWALEARKVDLIVASALTDIAGPRIHSRPISGLPLIHVEYPEFEGRKQFAKRMFDLVSSAFLIVILSPVMMAVAVAVKFSSRGPVFYSQNRIGYSGKSFPMFKFRSMVQDADDQLKSLLDQQGSSDTPLHKIENDPRITRVGRTIRRYSLDELPQLFNVFLGTMSLVGPRPQREAEVALYKDHHHRRLFVKPGITGLWQVSGRNNLSWDDSIRLDLYYVENWSMVGDLIILFRTVNAVVKPNGAY